MIEIIQPGPLALFQDLGRPGYTDLGVGRCGAFDKTAHRLANRLVGNSESAATIEITLGQLKLRLLQASTIAVTGARTDIIVEAGHQTRTHDSNTPLSLPADCTLQLGTPSIGVRSYLAVRGGFDAPVVLGSRSRDRLAGIGPAPLACGDRLATGTLTESMPASEPAPTLGDRSQRLRIIPGPRADWFADGALRTLTDSSWTLAQSSDRVGVRLHGPQLARRITGELPSEPTLPGAIQVPPDGQPIVLGPDAPVTGGYPVIAVLASGQLSRLGQARPGDDVRFIVT